MIYNSPAVERQSVGGLHDRPFFVPKTTVVYIDGFNFYYGAVKGTPHRWLDLQAFCTRLLKDDTVVAVKYFTSVVRGTKGDRQAQFLGALTTRPLVQVIYGKFKDRDVTCSHRTCTFPGNRVFKQPEEKRTDVAIAVNLVDDAYQGRCEKQILISGDSDLVPAVTLVRSLYPARTLRVYNPTPALGLKGRRADELVHAAGGDGRVLPTALFASCHLPATVVDSNGVVFTKPATW